MGVISYGFDKAPTLKFRLYIAHIQTYYIIGRGTRHYSSFSNGRMKSK